MKISEEIEIIDHKDIGHYSERFECNVKFNLNFERIWLQSRAENKQTAIYSCLKAINSYIEKQSEIQKDLIKELGK